MLWGDYANIRAFQSVVNGSVMDFYRFIGVERSVATRPETSIYALRGFTSTKYYFDFVGKTVKMKEKGIADINEIIGCVK